MPNFTAQYTGRAKKILRKFLAPEVGVGREEVHWI
jgi:hypothetical protein